MMTHKNIFLLGLITLAAHEAVLAVDINHAVMAVRATDLEQVEQLLQTQKYTVQELNQLIIEAGQVVSSNNASFNKTSEGIVNVLSTALTLGILGWCVYAAINAPQGEKLKPALYGGLFGLIFLPFDIYNIYQFRKNSLNSERAVKIAELLQEAKAGLTQK